MKKVSYKSIDKAIEICVKKGTRNLFAGKSDMSSAFRHCPIHKKFWRYLVMKAQDPRNNQWKYFVDKCLPFGAAISCAIFQAFSDAISHIVHSLTGEENVNYLDDYLFIAILERMCNWQLEEFLRICMEIRFPVALNKTVRACRRITFLASC